MEAHSRIISSIIKSAVNSRRRKSPRRLFPGTAGPSGVRAAFKFHFQAFSAAVPRSPSRRDTRRRVSHKILKRHCVPWAESHATDAGAGTSSPIDLERSWDGLSGLGGRGKVDVPGRPGSPGIPLPPTLPSTTLRSPSGESQLSDSKGRATISRVPPPSVFCGLLISPTVYQPWKRVQESRPRSSRRSASRCFTGRLAEARSERSRSSEFCPWPGILFLG